jgi:hypothetical protein
LGSVPRRRVEEGGRQGSLVVPLSDNWADWAFHVDLPKQTFVARGQHLTRCGREPAWKGVPCRCGEQRFRCDVDRSSRILHDEDLRRYCLNQYC